MALQRQQSINTATVAPPGACKVELDEVSESTYRYEGPKPQFVESAIIMLADSMEAASRSLKKVTPASIEDFVSRIVQGRIEDGQLDEVHLTMAEIARIRESFHFTLLNMLHSRIEYPKAEQTQKPRRNTPAPFPGSQEGRRPERTEGAKPAEQPAADAPKAPADKQPGKEAPQPHKGEEVEDPVAAARRQALKKHA
jgi:hypothetical protein